MRAPRLGIALIEKRLQAFEHLARQVTHRHQQPLLERRRAPHARERLDHDVEILAHARVLLLEPSGAQLRGDAGERRVGALDMRGLEVAYFTVEALEADLRHPLGIEAADHHQRLLAVAVTALDPGAVLRLARAAGCAEDKREHDFHNRFSRSRRCE